jgi:hypothetical protein
MIRPLLLLEMNEIPWRVVDRFFTQPEYPALNRFFSTARNLTNVAVDSGELSPWITWPTFHRGMPKEGHGIMYLGQDPATFRGTPIWEEYRRRDYSVGIFGSLQSWPPIDPGTPGFYIPDTFAHDATCVPAKLSPLQKFNLAQTAANGRVINRRSIWSRQTWELLRSLPAVGVRSRTVLMALAQLAGEQFDQTKTSRRPIFQALVMWDAFRKLFDPTHPPAFTTFFTNHVASAMHRYWNCVFPEDFADNGANRSSSYLGTMQFAMKVVDLIVAEAMGFCDTNPELIVVFATSMGQAAINRDGHEGVQVLLTDFGKLAKCLGLGEGSYRKLLAMVPQVAVEISRPEPRLAFIDALNSCHTLSGTKLFRVEQNGDSLSITLINPRRHDIEKGGFGIGPTPCRWASAGITVHQVDAGTAYHVPEGALAVWGSGISAEKERRPLRCDRAKDFLIQLGGLC